MKVLSLTYSVVFLFLSGAVTAQTADQQKVIDILDQISEVYNSKTKNLNFSITNTYRYSCSDSIIEKQDVDYHVRKGTYYINAHDYEYVITKSFFVSVNHVDKQIAYSDQPLLSYENLNNSEYIDNIRKMVLKNAFVRFDTIPESKEYAIHIKLLDTERQFNSIEIHYDDQYQFKSIKFIENANRTEDLFRLPNCIQIVYKNEDYTKVKNTPLKLNNYLTKKGDQYTPVSKYGGYEIIIQNVPYE